MERVLRAFRPRSGGGRYSFHVLDHARFFALRAIEKEADDAELDADATGGDVLGLA